MNYDVIFADLDGTIIRDDKTIPEKNIEVINKLNEMGVEFIISTGRSYMSLRRFNEIYNIPNNYNISFNGASIYKNRESNLLLNETIPVDVSKEILKFLKNKGVEIIVYADSTLFLENITDTTAAYARNSFLCPTKVRSLYRKTKTPTNKIIVFGENSVLKNIKNEFYNTDLIKKADCFFSSNNLLEFSPLNFSKGTALEYIMNLPDFKNKKSIAIGDSYNDISMFEKADLGIAVNNADKEVKDCANVVLNLDNNEGILTEVLEKYIV